MRKFGNIQGLESESEKQIQSHAQAQAQVGDLILEENFFMDDQSILEQTIHSAVQEAQKNTPYFNRQTNFSEDDFWQDSTSAEQESHVIFEDSKVNLSTERAAKLEANLLRRFSIGLYEADLNLLDQLVEQGKYAKLQHVSKAQIVREALKHFKMTWIMDASKDSQDR